MVNIASFRPMHVVSLSLLSYRDEHFHPLHRFCSIAFHSLWLTFLFHISYVIAFEQFSESEIKQPNLHYILSTAEWMYFPAELCIIVFWNHSFPNSFLYCLAINAQTFSNSYFIGIVRIVNIKIEIQNDDSIFEETKEDCWIESTISKSFRKSEK